VWYRISLAMLLIQWYFVFLGMAGRGRKSPEVVSDYLASLDWVYWKDDVRFRDGVELADIDDVRGQVYLNTGLRLGKKALESFIREQIAPRLAKPLDGIVLRKRPLYATVGDRTGLWYLVRGEDGKQKLCFVPAGAKPGTIEVFENEEDWPDGVYYHWELSEALPPPDPSGTIADLAKFWSEVAFISALGWETTLAMFLPAFWWQGVAAFILTGKYGCEQEDMISYSYISIAGGRAPFYVGKKPYDLLVVYWWDDLVFISSTYNRRLVPKLTHIVKAAVSGQTVQDRLTPKSRLNNFTLYAPVFICAAKAAVPEEMARMCLEVPTRPVTARFPFGRMIEPGRKAMNGAFQLFQLASRLPEPTHVLERYPTFPYRQWLSWAYRYADLLGVTDKLLSVVEKFGKVPKGIRLYKPRR
jgi:hypothetical protein